MSEFILWMLFAYTAGTAIGYYFGKNGNIKDALEMFLDRLIADGYIKTRGTGDDIELLKYWEEE